MFNFKFHLNKEKKEVNIEIGKKNSNPSFWSFAETLVESFTMGYIVYKIVVIIIVL
jgi:hypothetical protein